MLFTSLIRKFHIGLQASVPNLVLPSDLLHSYFNFRTTKYLTREGFYSFHNWFDDRAWYPLGRIIGGTIYPGKYPQKLVAMFLISTHQHSSTWCMVLCSFITAMHTISRPACTVWLQGGVQRVQRASLLFRVCLVNLSPLYVAVMVMTLGP